MSRAIWKTPFFFNKNQKKIKTNKKIKLYYFLTDKKKKIYNGKKYFQIKIEYNLLGNNIKNIVPSKKIVEHTKKKSRNKKKKVNNKIKSISLRLNYTKNYLNNFHQKNKPFISQIFLEKYIKSILNEKKISKTLRKSQKKYYKKKTSSLMEGELILLGKINIIQTLDGFYIKINYYLDDCKLDSEPQIFLKKKIKEIKQYLQKLFNCNIYIIKNNICKIINEVIFIYSKENLYKLKKKLLKKLEKKKKLLNILEKKFNLYKIIYKKYIQLKIKLNSFKKNKYFNRIHKIFFTVFLYNNLDLKLLVNAICYEFNKLKKGQIFLFRFLKEIFFYLYKTNIKKLNGLLFIVKGRIILKNRKTPRKKKFTLKLGKPNLSTLNSYINQENEVSTSKLGSININLLINFKKKNYINNKIYDKFEKKIFILSYFFFNKNKLKNNIEYLNYRLNLQKNLKFNDNFKKIIFTI